MIAPQGNPAVPLADLVMSWMDSFSKATWVQFSASTRDVLCAIKSINAQYEVLYPSSASF